MHPNGVTTGPKVGAEPDLGLDSELDHGPATRLDPKFGA